MMYSHKKRVFLKKSLISIGLSQIAFRNISLAMDVWPSGKPIKLIVPAQPGGGLDFIARIMADKLATATKVSWIAENIGGGGGSIASLVTARAPADGQTFMIVNISTHGTNPAVRNLPYDALKDFTHISMIGGSPNVLVSSNTLSPLGSLENLFAYLKSLNRPITYGSAGPGTSSHLLVEQLGASMGIAVTHVPYRGIGPALVDLMGGRLDIAFPGLLAAMQFIKSGRLIPYAITSSHRNNLLPQLPTFAEKGLTEFSSLQWYGISGPANLKPEITKALNNQIQRILHDQVLISKFESETLTVLPMSSTQFTEYVANDIQKWSKLVKDRNIKIEL